MGRHAVGASEEARAYPHGARYAGGMGIDGGRRKSIGGVLVRLGREGSAAEGSAKDLAVPRTAEPRQDTVIQQEAERVARKVMNREGPMMSTEGQA